jgi:transcriptional regulator with XRE-family HTH domain
MMKQKTNFDQYLEEQLQDSDFAARFKKAGEAWEIAMQLAALRKKSGLSQKELARRLGTSQQQISRLESPLYEGHSLSMLRRVAVVLGARVHIELQSGRKPKSVHVAEKQARYGVKKKNSHKIITKRK